MARGFHPPLEEYLEAIHELQEEGADVIQARLAERLGHSRPSVSETVKRLRDEGYIDVKGRSIVLTAAGRSRAESVVRKHRLAERLLTDVIGLEWHKVHVEAGRWEHVISDEVEERLIELLGNPVTCPHGNPIPGAHGPEVDLTPLADARTGQHVRLERVTEQVEVDPDALQRLDRSGFIPGASAEVVRRAPDGTVTVAVDGAAVDLEPSLTEQLYVTLG